MALTPYQLHNFVNDSEPDIDATNLNEIDQGIKDAIDGVNRILNALSSQIEDNPAKFSSSAALYAVNSSLNTVSTNLTTLQGTVSTLNSNLALKADNDNFLKYNMEYHARIYLTSGYISGMVNDKISQGYKGGDIALSSYAPSDTYNGNQYGIIQWTLVFSDIAHLRFLVPRSSAIITRAISVSESFDTGWAVH